MAKRRAIVNNLNLVPFIDLFSTLIIFLLATAVWDQLASVPVTLGTSDSNPIKLPSNPSDLKKINADLKVSINKDEIILIEMGKSTRIAREDLIPTDFSQVQEFAAAARVKFVDKKDVVLEMADESVYSDLVVVMDKFLAEDFDQLVVMGVTN